MMTVVISEGITANAQEPSSSSYEVREEESGKQRNNLGVQEEHSPRIALKLHIWAAWMQLSAHCTKHVPLE